MTPLTPSRQEQIEADLKAYRKEMADLLHKAAYVELGSKEEEDKLVQRILELKELTRVSAHTTSRLQTSDFLRFPILSFSRGV